MAANFIINQKHLKTPFDVCSYNIALNNYDNGNYSIDFVTIHIIDGDDTGYANNRISKNASPFHFYERIHQYFIDRSITNIIDAIIYDDGVNQGVSFVFYGNNWGDINTTYTTELANNFAYTTRQKEFDNLSETLKAASGGQLSNIAAKSSPINLYTQFVSIVAKDSVDLTKEYYLLSELINGYKFWISNSLSAFLPSNFDYLSDWTATPLDRERSYKDFTILYGKYHEDVDHVQLFAYDDFVIPTVDKWYIDDIVSASTGKSATVITAKSYTGDVAAILQYSIDGINWQTSSTLSGLTPNATYKAYVKDQFEGIDYISFTTEAAPEVNTTDPYFKIENCNSIKFFEVNDKKPFFDNALVSDQLYTNVEMRCMYQPFLSNDTIKTQIKATYRNIVAKVYNLAGVLVQTATAELKVKHTGLVDRRDAMFIRSVDGLKTYIYFQGGNIYDPETLAVTSTYAGQTYLPSFCKVGIYVELVANNVTGNYQVTEILYNATLQKWVMSIDYQLPSANIAGVAISTYNEESFNVYEFDTTFGALPAGTYRIIVTATDESTNYPAVEWRSEPIKTKATLKHHLQIDAYHSENVNQVDYSTGIAHRIHVPGQFVDFAPTFTAESFKDDNAKTVNLKRVTSRVVVLKTAFITQYVFEKLCYFLSEDNLKVNGYACTLIEDVEFESKIEDNAPLYTVKAQLQLDEAMIVTTQTGIVSEGVSVLGASSTTVIGI